MTYPVFDIGDVVRYNAYGSVQVYFLITGFDRDGNYEVLCLQSDDIGPFAWRQNKTGGMDAATLESFGEKVA